jgi:hypothetical protein
MGIPTWLKVVYTLWMAVWVPAYWIDLGAANFLWLCDLANFVVGLAIWLESPLLFASQALSVLLIQILWTIDFFTRLALGFHPIGGTEYMFDAAKPLFMRLLSLFHLWMPVLLVWAVWRLGYERRGLKLQTAIAWTVLPLSLLPDPERNINWLHAPFEIPQTWVPTWVFLVICMAAHPLLVYLPTHLVLRRLAPPVEAD